MDLPKAPQEQELKNIIDKLAQFVARNGLEFEQMTKTKQKDNPKFSFLFGGDYFSYYQYKVNTEQAILKHRQTREQTTPQHPPQLVTPHSQPPSLPPYSGQSNPNFQNSYPYNYGPSSNYGGDPSHFPPGVVANNYPSPQFNVPPIPGDSQSMHMGGGPMGMSGNNFGSHSLPPSSYHSGDQPYMQGGNNADRPYPGGPSHSGFHPPGNLETTYGGPQAPPMMPPGTEHGNSNSSGYPLGPPRHLGGNPPSTIPLGGNVPSSAASQGPPDVPNQAPISEPTPDISIEQILQEEQQLQEQISQSEQNLTAQQLVLDQQREVQVRDGIYIARGDLLKKEAAEFGLNLQEFEDLLIPITESCTKDSISNGKHWIFTHAVSPHINHWISTYLLYKSTALTGPFTHKLHIIYLMNDVLHHCLRKNADNLKDFLEKSLSPMYCNAYTCATDDQRVKLEKLLSLWESKIQLDQSLLNELRNPEETVANFNNNLMNEFSQVVTTASQNLSTSFDAYKQQHNAFLQHANSQLQQLQQQKRQHEQNQLQQQQAPPPSHSFLPPMQQPQFPDGGSQPPIPHGMDFNQPPPGFSSGGFPIPDFSKPPPGFVCEERGNVVPTVPYFELPAALMAPLISISDSKLKPLDPSKLRLPLPTPPSERLLAAVENFYLPPSHDRPRNCDGWEQIALFDYYKAKTNSVREKEKMVKEGIREKSRSPSPVVIEVVTDEDLYQQQGPLRRYRSVSPEEFEEKDEEETQPSPPSTRRRSQSPSPIRHAVRSPLLPNPRLASRSPSYSPPRRSSSRSPPHGGLSRSPPRGRYSRSPPSQSGFSRARSRSVTPPSFSSMAPYSIEETNKGHQMLLSMGWSGAGLGVKEQGIATPISAAEVRETPAERFRGLGIPSAQSDPFEAFRKNKGQAFINRMKQRAEEREKKGE